MKFHEAIDMILDGGKTYLNKSPYREIYFDETSKILCQGYDDTGHIEAPYLFKDELRNENWIVEKDGVVYEEYPLQDKLNNIVSSIDQNKIYIPDIDEIHLPIIADKVDEDWLDKKMLCFIRRQFAGFATFSKVAESTRCDSKDCPFCFPEDKSDQILKWDDRSPKFEEDKPEKVTFYEMSCLITSFAEDYHLSKAMGDHGSVKQYILENSKIEKLLREKLEYLVSLQDK